MGYREDMADCRDYISSSPGRDLTPQELAQRYGYSFYHFCHVFRSVNGLGVGEYLRHHRLNRAAALLREGAGVTETAMSCGFDTPSGFTKAFVRRFGCSPSAYKRAKGGMIQMQPEFKKLAAFTAIGYMLKPESEIDILENGAYWLGQDFSAVSQEDYAKLTYPGYAEIGAWMHPDDGGELYYFFGPQVKDKSFVPQGMQVLEVPAAEYAVFTAEKAGSAPAMHENVKKAWKYIFNDWFDASGYAFDQSKMDFEMYLGEDAFIYVPVKKK